MSAYEQPPLDPGTVCQRWKNRRHSWRPTSEGGFDSTRYRVREMPNHLVHTAKAFVRAHHYSGSWPVIFTVIFPTATSATCMLNWPDHRYPRGVRHNRHVCDVVPCRAGDAG